MQGSERERGESPLGPILPAQFFTRLVADAWLPEKRLMAAVLEEAVTELRRLSRCPTPRTRARRLELELWFALDDTGQPFSFASICHVLGLEASWVRAALARLLAGEHGRPGAAAAHEAHP